jgi:hypothetical protein
MKEFIAILMVTLLSVVFLVGTAGALPLEFEPIFPISEPVAMIVFGFGLNCVAVISRKKFCDRGC